MDLGRTLKRNLARRERVRRARRYLTRFVLDGVDREVSQLARIVEVLSVRHYEGLPLPPSELRKHVGASDSAANFLGKGLDYSQEVLDAFGEQPPGPVLDWGCGSGRTLRWLLHYPGWRENWFGCDVDQQAISWLAQQGVERAQVCSTEPPLPYQAESFHGLFAFSVLTHLHPQLHRSWYEEFRRVLVPGSLAFLTYQGETALSNDRFPFPAGLREGFDAEGFAFLEYPGHYKSGAYVNEAFTRRAVAGCFEVESFEQAAMDRALLRAL